MGLTASNTLVATTLQQHIPLSVLSRVSAYDCTASCAYIPLGLAVAGPQQASWACPAARRSRSLSDPHRPGTACHRRRPPPRTAPRRRSWGYRPQAGHL